MVAVLHRVPLQGQVGELAAKLADLNPILAPQRGNRSLDVRDIHRSQPAQTEPGDAKVDFIAEHGLAGEGRKYLLLQNLDDDFDGRPGLFPFLPLESDVVGSRCGLDGQGGKFAQVGHAYQTTAMRALKQGAVTQAGRSGSPVVAGWARRKLDAASPLEPTGERTGH